MPRTPPTQPELPSQPSRSPRAPPSSLQNKTEAAKQRFLDISAAYDVLSDPKKRQTYDRYGEEGLKRQQQQGGGGGFHDPFDMFRNAFGGGHHQQERRGQNMVADVEVELESIYKGDEMTVSWRSSAVAVAQESEQAEGMTASRGQR